MGLFSKKKEERSLLPDLPESEVELPRLPEFGNSSGFQLNSDVPMNSMFPVRNPQDAIKKEIHGTINNNQWDMQKTPFEPLPYHNGLGMPAKIIAEPSYIMESPSGYHSTNHESIREPRTMEMNKNCLIASNIKKSQPVYIRLDKFKEGLQSFEDIKGKLTEIEDLLSKIREMKDKEERELEEWEREIQIVKARIEQIDNDVFRNVE